MGRTVIPIFPIQRKLIKKKEGLVCFLKFSSWNSWAQKRDFVVFTFYDCSFLKIGHHFVYVSTSWNEWRYYDTMNLYFQFELGVNKWLMILQYPLGRIVSSNDCKFVFGLVSLHDLKNLYLNELLKTQYLDLLRLGIWT